jgi:hypothetical protein
VPVDDEALFDAISTSQAFQGVRCTPNETRESCFRRFVEGEMTAIDSSGQLETFDAFTTYWHGALLTEARMRALLGVAAARLHRLRTGTCPDAQALSSDAMDTGFGGAFSFTEDGEALEIQAPDWLDERAPQPLDEEALTLAWVPCDASP